MIFIGNYSTSCLIIHTVYIASCLNKDHIVYSSPLEAKDTTTHCLI